MILPSVEILIVVDDAGLHDFDRIVFDLKNNGVEIDFALEAIGVISGKISSQNINVIKTINGIKSVELSEIIQVPDSEEEIQ